MYIYCTGVLAGNLIEDMANPSRSKYNSNVNLSCFDAHVDGLALVCQTNRKVPLLAGGNVEIEAQPILDKLKVDLLEHLSILIILISQGALPFKDIVAQSMCNTYQSKVPPFAIVNVRGSDVLLLVMVGLGDRIRKFVSDLKLRFGIW